MNTPAHAILNLAVLGRETPGQTVAILVGAVLPDAPMFLFFVWESFVLGTSQPSIWGDAYFRDSWQGFFDVFNSIPLWTLAMVVAWWARWDAGRVLCASATMHCFLDLPLHHDDSHRHFLPFSEFRFASPVSYWDPAHFGAVGAFGEVIVVWVGGAILWRRHPRRAARVVLAALALLSFFGYVGFYVLWG
jgi:hypothetical protein